MEWYDKINEFVNGLPEWVQAHPKYGYLVVSGVLAVWLAGIVLGWRWTYARPGSWGGNYWLGLLGEKTYRFWLGIIVAVALVVSIMLCCMTGEGNK